TSKQATTSVAGLTNEINGLVLAPNPNKGSFIIKAEGIGNDKATVYITNTLGQQVYAAEVAVHGGSLSHSVNLSDKISSGVYVVRIESGNSHQVLKFTVSE